MTDLRDTINALYRDYAGREATAGDQSYWSGFLAGGGGIGDVRQAILNDAIGIAHTASSVNALYTAYLGREPDAGEIAYWDAQIRAGMTFAAMRTTVLDDAGGQAHTAATISDLYQTFIGREATSFEQTYWSGQVREGSDFAAVRHTIVNDAGAIQHTEAVVGSFYASFLGRQPGAAELDYWGALIRGGTDLATVRTIIVDDAGARSHSAGLIADLYQSYFERPATSGEQDYWLAQFRAGADFDTLRAALIAAQPAVLAPDAEHIAEINDLYLSYFGRASSDAENRFWDDLFHSGASTDVLLDTLMTDPGSDATNVLRFTANSADDDVFLLGPELGRSVVEGFDPAEDRFDLRLTNYQDIDVLGAAHARELTALDGRTDVLISFDEDNSILLTGITLAHLETSMFLL